jgi:capsular polysaccharide transport system permease protein
MNHVSIGRKLATALKKPITLFVVLPLSVFIFYEIIWATPRYESQVQLIIQQPNGGVAVDPASVLLSGFTGVASNSDIELVRKFIHSNDMLSYLREVLEFKEHYSNSDIDMFSRLANDASNEKVLDYFISIVKLEVDEKSSVLTVKVQAFEPEFTQRLASSIANRAEWFINKISNDLAESQLVFVQQEHKRIEQRLEKSKASLLNFQRQYNLIDPTAESLALQQITNQLDAQIAAKEAELNSLLTSMSENATPVVVIKQELLGLKAQLENERQRMTVRTGTENSSISPDGVNEIVAQFSQYKVNLELALQAYTASQLSMEKARIEAYRQIKYLVRVESATLPESAKYPRVTYNIVLFIIVNMMLFGVAKILVATFEELR